MTRKLLILVVLLLVSAPVFAQSVDTAWVRRYNGPGNGTDWARAIVVDGSGNVYVTGYSWDSLTNFDYATIKYYPNGDTAWVRRYNRPGNGNDQAYAMALYDSNFVYVAGGSYDSVTYDDYATIKYYPNGDTAWVRRYNGPGNRCDQARAIVVDGSSNAYVTGLSMGSGTSSDYATIKYYPNGDTAWVRRYNGPTNSDDDAFAIAVDGSGNVCITGQSIGIGTYWDYATIKYDPDGNELWVSRYNGPENSFDGAEAIVLDDTGNIYVSGVSYNTVPMPTPHYATIMYYPDGDTAWVRRYNGPANIGDYAHAIAVDDSSNVYVTGQSRGDSTYDDYATIMYYPDGDTAWVRRYNGPGNGEDKAHAIVVDDSHNVYVTGATGDTLISADYATIKYDSDGNELWVSRYNGPGNYHDNAYAIAVDDSCNVYVTGESYGSGTDYDYATIKYVQFLRGDVNKDWVINSADIAYLINYLFINGPAPIPILHVGDVNVDEAVNSADVAYLINYLFIGGPAPCQ